MSLQRKEEALAYLDYHAPTSETIKDHQAVNEAFQRLLDELWDHIPEGPGKTVAIRAMNRARMECNSAIANGGN